MPQQNFTEYRIAALEVKTDELQDDVHELKIFRARLEARLGLYAAMGAVIGGAIASGVSSLIVAYLLH